jgi:site-specific recombinase XerD
LSIFSANFSTLLQGYRLFATSAGHSQRSIEAVESAVHYFTRFLSAFGPLPAATEISAGAIQGFIRYLQQKKRYSGHPFTPESSRLLSSHTVNCYARSLRVFFSWLFSEGIIESHPFEKVKIPRPMRKVIATFSTAQLQALISAINISTPVGQRDLTMLLLMLDSGMRVSELCGIELEDLRLEEGIIKVLGKGNKERLIPVGKQVQKLLWHYINRFRPEPMKPQCRILFLTDDGYPMHRERVGEIFKRYGNLADIQGVRCSPHTFRHTAAVSFLRNGGDVFSLQRLLGHSSLEMTRRYSELADIDIQRAHRRASPVDNLEMRLPINPQRLRQRY